MQVRRLKVKQPPKSNPPKVWKWVRKALKLWIWMFTTVAFMLFICEESTQLLGFSRMNYRNIQTTESYKAWIDACERDTKIVNACRIAAGATWIINPISSVTFAMYFDQEKIKLGRETWIAKRLLAEAEGKEEVKHELAKAAVHLENSFTQPQTTNNGNVILDAVHVYATKSGGTYHKATCYHLYTNGKQKAGLRQYTVEAALAAYLRPCVRCKPGRN